MVAAGLILPDAVLLTTSRGGGFGASTGVPNWDYSATSRLFAPILNGDQGERGHSLSRSSGPCATTASESARNEREKPSTDVGPLLISHAQAAEKGGKPCSWGSALLLECIARLPERYIETENRRLTDVPVSTPPILLRWFSNQWLTDSLVAHPYFYFL